MQDNSSALTRAGASVSAWASTVDWIAVGKKGAFAFLALELWTLQYVFWVPAVLAGRLFVQALRAVRVVAKSTAWLVLGILLLFVPLLGWVVLLFIAQMRANERQAERHHAELMAALTGTKPGTAVHSNEDQRSIFRPWLLDWVKTNTRGPVTRESIGTAGGSYE